MLVGEDVAIGRDNHARAGSSASGGLTVPTGGASLSKNRDDAGGNFADNLFNRAVGEVGGITVGTTIIKGDGLVAAKIV